MLGWLSVAHAKVGRCHEEFEMRQGNDGTRIKKTT